MRDFSNVADFIVPRRRQTHLVVFMMSLLMLPGISATFSPIDIESYDLESPELDANDILMEEFSAAGGIEAFGIYLKIKSLVKSDSDASMIAGYTGNGVGVMDPYGGILNLSVLRELTQAQYLRNHEVPFLPTICLPNYRSPVVESDLATDFRSFMSGQSSLTSPRITLMLY